MESADIRLLGPLAVLFGGQPLSLGYPRQRSVLAILLMSPNAPVSAERLTDLLWDDDPPATARNVLHGYVAGIRQVFAAAATDQVRLVRRDGGYVLELDPQSIDLVRFRRLACQGRACGDDDQMAALLSQALGLWRGQPLADLVGRWARSAGSVLEEERLAVAFDLYDAELRRGRHSEVLAHLHELAAARPLDERLAGLRMLALYRAGRQDDALQVFRDLRTSLASDLGIEPGPELQDLHQKVLRGDLAQTTVGSTRAVRGVSVQRQLPAGSARELPDAGLLAREFTTPEGTEPDAFPALQDLLGEPPAKPSAPAVTFSLPPDTAAFTGRSRELNQITAAVTGAAGAGGVVTLRAIGGMPGVGKTVLAVHAAHQLRAEFPDRQLFLNLHAHTPGREPVRPEDALAGLLAATGVDPRFMPAGLDGRAAMWRDKMAGQRALLVLDNAASTGQVTPLLPGTGECLVLVTSRRHLGDLPGALTPVLLDALPPEQAAEMFTRLAPRAAGDPAGVAQVVQLAGFLPLAVSLLARVFARHPLWSLADLAAETRAGLLTLTAEHDSVVAAFEVSYQHLDPARQRFFRLLGVHPGSTTDAYAAAALAGVSTAAAAGLLDRLHGEGLLTETGYRRYSMHDLLRRYARGHAAADPERDQAAGRLLDYYQHAAARAQALLARQARPAPAAPGAPLAAPALEDAGQALAWARADRDNLLACLDHVTRTGQHARVVALTAALTELLRRDGPWAEAVTRHAAAAQAACHLGDQLSQAGALTWLGDGRYLTGDYPGAARDLEQALTLYRDLGSRLGQANALTRLGVVRRVTGDFPGAAGDLEQAMILYRDLGDRLGQAGALTSLGDVRRLTGDYPGAAGDLEQALSLYRDLGDRLGQADALASLGDVRRLTGDYPGAAGDLEQALSLYRDLGSRHGQAGALASLGNVRRLTGDYPGAARDLEQALTLYRDLGDRGGEAAVLNERGTLHRASGDLAPAGQCHRQALELARAIASAWDEASALAGLGRCAITAGQSAHAEALLRQAHEIFHRIGAADAATVLAELNALTIQDPA